MKYPEQYIGFVVSKKIETSCCDHAPKDLAMPASVASALKAVGGFQGLARKIPAESELRKEASRYQSLADNTRLRILWALNNIDLCPCALKVITGISDSKLSYHLKILESENLIRARRAKNWRVYSITNDGKESLVGPRTGKR